MTPAAMLGQLATPVTRLPVLLAALLIPLSLAQLAVTHSPWQSFNPAAMYRLLRWLGNRNVIANVNR